RLVTRENAGAVVSRCSVLTGGLLREQRGPGIAVVDEDPGRGDLFYEDVVAEVPTVALGGIGTRSRAIASSPDQVEPDTALDPKIDRGLVELAGEEIPGLVTLTSPVRASVKRVRFTGGVARRLEQRENVRSRRHRNVVAVTTVTAARGEQCERPEEPSRQPQDRANGEMTRG